LTNQINTLKTQQTTAQNAITAANNAIAGLKTAVNNALAAIIEAEGKISSIVANEYLNVPNKEWFGTWWLELQDGSYNRIS